MNTPDTANATIESSARRRLLIAVNPQKRDAPELAASLARLVAGDVEIDLVDLDVLSKDRDQAFRAARESSAIVVSGGDGSLYHAAPFLREAGRPVGILPTGTANDFARTMGIPFEPVAAAEVILAGHTRLADLGEANGHLFFNVASLGMSVALTARLTRERKRRWGRSAYVLTAVEAAATIEPFSARIVTSHETVDVRTLQIAVGNGRYYGGGSTVDENATIDDGVLHLYSLEMSSPWAMLPMLWAFRNGTHGRWASVRTAVGTEMRVETRRPRDINADGEIITTTPCTFRVIAKALAVLAPPKASNLTGAAV